MNFMEEINNNLGNIFMKNLSIPIHKNSSILLILDSD